MLSLRDGVFENFLLPSRDLFGFCDNFKSATFLKDVQADEKGSCVQSITSLEKAAETFLNPEWYTEREYLKGSSTGSKSVEFNEKTVKIFVKDRQTGQITQQSDNAPQSPVVVSTAAECRVDNWVGEVFYRVFYSDTKDGLYTIDDIQLEFMLESSLSIDPKYCQPGNTDAYLIT